LKELINNHEILLKKIILLIKNNFRIDDKKIELIYNEIIDNSVLRFQLKFIYPYSNPMKPIYLNFEIYQSYPNSLHFETISGLRKYDNSNYYKTIETDIIHSISKQINK